MKIAVIGTGYVGLTTAVALASLGHDIVGIDIDQHRVADLNNGHCPLVEEGLPELLTTGLEESALSFTTEIIAASTAELIFLCLPTPASATGHPDLSAVETTCLALHYVAPVGAVVVCKSTVPVGTNHRIQQWLNRDDLTVASNPEFLREGTALADFLRPDRVVIGVDDALDAAPLEALYQPVSDNIHVVGPTEAELIKYAANAFLATKLSFVNEIARLCTAADADPAPVLAGLGADERISSLFLTPGPGWGGSCFPKDTVALQRLASDLGVEAPVVGAAIASNRAQADYIVAAITTAVSGPPAKIAVWGLTFKAGTDDTRDSPAVAIVERLVAQGYAVVAYDPAAKTTPDGVTRATSALSATQGAELLVVLTEWAEFAQVDMHAVRDNLVGRRILDTRNIVDTAEANAAGLELGYPKTPTMSLPC